MKKRNKIIIATILIVILIAVSTTLAICFQPQKRKSAILNTTYNKNVIIFIGDGMGKNHIENTKIYFDLSKQVFENDYACDILTHSLSSPITDSAASATALSTGKKVHNGQISYHSGNNLKTIMEIAKSYGKKTGVITTDYLNGATPSAFSSHAKNRGDSQDIILGQANSNMDLLIGEYSQEYYDSKTLFEDNNFNYVESLSELQSQQKNQKVVANLNGLKSIYNSNFTNQIEIKSLLNFALNFLDNENGFVLMVESAYIDKYSHNNDIIPALCETRSLFNAIDFAYDYYKNDTNTSIIVTSDHETGGLKLAQDKTEISSSLYTRDGHSGKNVNLYITNYEGSFKDEEENTIIFDLMNNFVVNYDISKANSTAIKYFILPKKEIYC